jgi:uncharacterized protein YjbJ (UPF0337 family)
VSRLLPQTRKEQTVSDHKTDEAKGRTKEAAGSLTDNKDLKKEGKADRAAGGVKEKVDKAKDKLTGKD